MDILLIRSVLLFLVGLSIVITIFVVERIVIVSFSIACIIAFLCISGIKRTIKFLTPSTLIRP